MGQDNYFSHCFLRFLSLGKEVVYLYKRKTFLCLQFSDSSKRMKVNKVSLMFETQNQNMGMDRIGKNKKDHIPVGKVYISLKGGNYKGINLLSCHYCNYHMLIF